MTPGTKPTLLQHYATHQAGLRPDAIALVMADEQLTYAELEERSNRLARMLRDAGCRRGDRVCLFQPKSLDAIVAMLATLKADCAYVPIDVASPAPRVAKIVESAEPRVVLAAASQARLVDEALDEAELPARPLVGAVDVEVAEVELEAAFGKSDWQRLPAEPVATANSEGDPAHLLFTSGSTGVPKGVVITHAMVARFVEWATAYFGTSPGERISGHPPLHFDLSTFDIYGTFLAGAELHLVPPALNLTPHKLAAFIRESELVQWFAVPSIFTFMAKFDAVAQDDFPTLERVLWCGEVLPTPILSHWMRRLPHARFTNLYGPTEATIASSYYTVPRIPATETEPIPIGTACEGEELLVLDEQLRPVASGEVGDLFIAGVGLSPGYWRDEEKTKAAFIQDPRSSDPDARIYRTGDLARVADDELIHFLGRADSQIKSRGYRIELGEIETALNALDDIRECAVVGADTGGFEGTAICCAYSTGSSVEPPALRDRLLRVLPTYMLPTRWLVLDELPKNVNGKIDRRRLREHFEQESPAGAQGRERATEKLSR